MKGFTIGSEHARVEGMRILNPPAEHPFPVQYLLEFSNDRRRPATTQRRGPFINAIDKLSMRMGSSSDSGNVTASMPPCGSSSTSRARDAISLNASSSDRTPASRPRPHLSQAVTEDGVRSNSERLPKTRHGVISREQRRLCKQGLVQPDRVCSRCGKHLSEIEALLTAPGFHLPSLEYKTAEYPLRGTARNARASVDFFPEGAPGLV